MGHSVVPSSFTSPGWKLLMFDASFIANPYPTLDLLRPLIAPPEYDPPLIVYSDRMLASEVSSQSFQSVARRRVGGAPRSVKMGTILSL
jgi:hypothetical protein